MIDIIIEIAKFSVYGSIGFVLGCFWIASRTDRVEELEEFIEELLEKLNRCSQCPNCGGNYIPLEKDE